jgi:hypothetical protein
MISKNHHLPKIKNKYRISIVVEELAAKRFYEKIKNMSMRDSYYFIRAKLDSEVDAGRINPAEFQYFQDHYKDQYALEWWTQWEKKYCITRPETKDNTSVWWHGRKLESNELKSVIERARGFIFVEKEGMAKKLLPLSWCGYILLGAQGQSTRILRERLKTVEEGKETRPIVRLTDCDEYGQIISDVFEEGSRRTTHLNLKFQNVIHLGLTVTQADKLGLPWERYKDKSGTRAKRVELNAFVYLEEKHRLKNPFLTFVVHEMRKNLLLSELPSSWRRIVKRKVKRKVEDEFRDFLDPIVDEKVDELIGEDETSVDLEFEENEDDENDAEIKVDFESMESKLKDIAHYWVLCAQQVDEQESDNNNIEDLDLPEDTTEFMEETLT